MRRRMESVWQIMWMLRVSGPPGNEQDTSKFVVVSPVGNTAAAPSTTPPDMTEATDTLADLLIRIGDELRLSPAESAKMFRLVTFASAHPRITDGQTLPTAEIVRFAAARHQRCEKFTSPQSEHGEDSPGPVDRLAAALSSRSVGGQ